ncbi:MAG TPA: NADH-quinone oxidoreductase subunit J, partial [Anaerolineales bacterium]|nr:NADH-quinone oxidoreductase subunit J [Anaerolineales bacterium]
AQHNRGWWLSAAFAAISFLGLVWMQQGWGGGAQVAGPMPADFDAIGLLGEALISPNAFVLPFEVASVLLVAALIGAVYVAFTRKQEQE